MSIRSYLARSIFRLVLVAVLVFQGMLMGSQVTRMAVAQAVAGPQDTVVICTPEGFKTVLWSDVSGDQTLRVSGCACPCTASCGHCGLFSPNFLTAAIQYGGVHKSEPFSDEFVSVPYGPLAFSSGGARAPPVHLS